MVTTGFAGLSRVMKFVIVASLALNLLVIGALATAWFRHGGKHFHHGGIERSLMHYAHRKLPRERRKALRKAWRAERKTLRPLIDDVRSARKAFGRVLQADTYDRTAVETALADVRQKRAAVRQQASNKFLDLLETLSDEEKRAFGSYLQQDRRGKWRRRHKGYD